MVMFPSAPRLLVPASGALLIVATGERRANVRDFGRLQPVFAVGSCRLDHPEVLAGRVPDACSLGFFPDRDRISGRCFGLLLP